MEYLIWFGIFLVLALLATVPVHFHLSAPGSENEQEAKKQHRSAVKKTECPHCGEMTSSSAAFCESCGVPTMLWTLKKAREVKAGQDELFVPIVDQDLCIGCSSCVAACEEGVLEIVAGKSTVVNLSVCTSAATCVEACPTGACQLGGGGASRRVEVPQLNGDFQTNQPGIYVVGELGGLGLIKNAITEGQLAIERIAAKHTPVDGLLDLVIVGAGPAGLSAGLAAKSLGLSHVLLEQGSLANTIRRFPNRKIVMAEPVKIPLYGSLWVSDAPKETLLAVWETIVSSVGLSVREHEKVTAITRKEGFFLVKSDKDNYKCQKVVLAIGKRGTPNELPVKGHELAKVRYQLSDSAQYTGKKILIVGGGDSAAEAAIGLSKQPGNEVTLSYRRSAFTRLREKNLEAVNRFAREKKLTLCLGSQVQEVRDDSVTIGTHEGERIELENDYVFAFLGGTSPRKFLEKIGIEVVTKEVSVEGDHAGV